MKIIKLQAIFIFIVFISSCDSSDPLVDVGINGSIGTGSTIYATIQMVTDEGRSAYSNEIQVPSTTVQANVTWSQPTKAIDGSCLAGTVQSYIGNLGSESGLYTATVNIPLTSINCAPSGSTDAACSNVAIQTCTLALDLSQF